MFVLYVNHCIFRINNIKCLVNDNFDATKVE